MNSQKTVAKMILCVLVYFIYHQLLPLLSLFLEKSYFIFVLWEDLL